MPKLNDCDLGQTFESGVALPSAGQLLVLHLQPLFQSNVKIKKKKMIVYSNINTFWLKVIVIVSIKAVVWVRPTQRNNINVET